MAEQRLLIFFAFTVAGGVSLMLAGLARLRSRLPGAPDFSRLCLASAVWCLANAASNLAIVQTRPVWIVSIQYLCSVLLPALWLSFTLAAARLKAGPHRFWSVVLWLVPGISLLLALSNDWHGWVWSAVTYAPGGDPQPLPAPWFWFTTLYGYLLALGGMFVLIWTSLQYVHNYRRRPGLLLAGLLLPWLANAIHLANTAGRPAIDLTPLVFVLNGVLFAWSILRQPLDLTPSIYQTLLDNLEEGVLVLDDQDNILEINPAAQQILNVNEQPMFRLLLSDVFPIWPEICAQLPAAHLFQWQAPGQAQRSLHIQSFPLRSGAGAQGRLLVLRDVTATHQLERSEDEQRMLANALGDSALALNSALTFDQILDLIFQYARQVIPHDAANIALIDEENVAHFTRAHGYQTRGLQGPALDLRLTMANAPNWRKMSATAQAVVTPDTHSEADWSSLPETTWIRSYLGAPILLNGKVCGFINMDSAIPGFYTQEHARRLQIFAQFAALAIEQSQLAARTQQYATSLAVLRQLGVELSDPRGDEQLMHRLRLACMQVATVDSFYVALWDETTQMIQFPLFYDSDGPTLNQRPAARDRNTLSGYILDQGQTVYIPDTLDAAHPPPAPLFRTGGKTTRSYLGVPLWASGKTIGVVSIQAYQPEAYRPDQIEFLETLAGLASLAIRNTRLTTQREQLATTDELTGLYNRQQFLVLASNELEQAWRQHRDLSVILMDIDLFKQVNEAHGHHAGDQVLITLAGLCRQMLRENSLIGRYGGEEFAILLTDTGLSRAQAIAERLRLLVAAQEIATSHGSIKVTASFGLAAPTDRLLALPALLDHADQALQQAKQAGRNRIMIYQEH